MSYMSQYVTRISLSLTGIHALLSPGCPLQTSGAPPCPDGETAPTAILELDEAGMPTAPRPLAQGV